MPRSLRRKAGGRGNRSTLRTSNFANVSARSAVAAMVSPLWASAGPASNWRSASFAASIAVLMRCRAVEDTPVPRSSGAKLNNPCGFSSQPKRWFLDYLGGFDERRRPPRNGSSSARSAIWSAIRAASSPTPAKNDELIFESRQAEEIMLRRAGDAATMNSALRAHPIPARRSMRSHSRSQLPRSPS